jgi:hypothetical protein
MCLIWRVMAGMMATGLVALLASCGGGDGQISGTITGLSSNGLVLSDGTDSLTLTSGTTSFTFPTLLTDNVTYNVVVTTQPTGLFCTVTNGSGTVSSSTPSAAITIACAASFNLSGTITGLTGSGLVLSDGVENISVAAGAPSFAFPTLLSSGTTYSVTIATQPSNQTCTVLNGDFTVANEAITNVIVSCP